VSRRLGGSIEDESHTLEHLVRRIPLEDLPLEVDRPFSIGVVPQVLQQCTTVGDDETPAAEALAAGPPPTFALGPGAPQERLGDAIAKAQRQERARRRR
jgi:hypothetical protein